MADRWGGEDSQRDKVDCQVGVGGGCQPLVGGAFLLRLTNSERSSSWLSLKQCKSDKILFSFQRQGTSAINHRSFLGGFCQSAPVILGEHFCSDQTNPRSGERKH